MKPVLTLLIGVAVLAAATAASAHMVEITVSIPAVKAADDADLKQALASAVDDAVKNAIAFTPTMVTLQNARRVGDRIYIVLLVVDRDGEEMMKQLAIDEGTSSSEDDSPSDAPAASGTQT
jgi:hypothetical protein